MRRGQFVVPRRLCSGEIDQKRRRPGFVSLASDPRASVLSAFGGGFAGLLCLASRALSSAFWGRGVGLLEELTYRLYQCRRCGTQVQICPHFDHGNIYCAGNFSRLVRAVSVCVVLPPKFGSPSAEPADMPSDNAVTESGSMK